MKTILIFYICNQMLISLTTSLLVLSTVGRYPGYSTPNFATRWLRGKKNIILEILVLHKNKKNQFAHTKLKIIYNTKEKRNNNKNNI